MFGFQLKGQRPPKPRRVKEGVVMRFDHVYEIDPERMSIIKQQEMPVWDTQRIIANRWEHLSWMHNHFADSVISGEELEKEIEESKKKIRTTKKSTSRRKKR